MFGNDIVSTPLLRQNLKTSDIKEPVVGFSFNIFMNFINFMNSFFHICHKYMGWKILEQARRNVFEATGTIC